MKDAGFYVAGDKVGRLATPYSTNEKNQLVVVGDFNDYSKPPGHGIRRRWFDVDRRRLHTVRSDAFERRRIRRRPSTCAIERKADFFEPSLAKVDDRRIWHWVSAHETGFGFWIDPTEDIVFVGMVQRMLGLGVPNLEHLSRVLTYQALIHPEK